MASKRGATTQLTKDNPADDADDYADDTPKVLTAEQRANRVIMTAKRRHAPESTASGLFANTKLVINTPANGAGTPGIAPKPNAPPSLGSASAFTGVKFSPFPSLALTTDSSLSNEATSATVPSGGTIPSASASAAAQLPAATTAARAKEDLPEEYYRALKGLNRSFLTHLTDQFAKDDFADFCVALDKYRNYRADIMRKYGVSEDGVKVPPAAAPTVIKTSGFATQASLPTPQSAVSDAASAKLAVTGPLSGTDKPAGGEKAIGNDKPTTVEPATPSTGFGGVTSEGLKATNDAKGPVFDKPALFTIGSTDTSRTGASTNTESEATSTASKSVFGFGTFGSSAGTTASSTANFSFGGGSPFTLGGATSSGSLFSGSTAFGSGTANPVGLSLFGSKPASTSAEPGDADADGDGGDDDEPLPAEEPTKPDQFKKGAGEENEDTLLEVENVRLLLLQKGAWEKMGAGLIRVNEDRETKKRRILARSEGVGQVLLNTYLFSGMTAKAITGGKQPTVELLCLLPGKGLSRVLVRLNSDDDAKRLADTIMEKKPSA